MASLIAVIMIITIRGTALSPGFVAPKIGKHCASCQSKRSQSASRTHGKNNNKEKVNISNIVELVP